MSWLRDNLGTIVVSLILAAIVILVILKMVKDKKKGKISCGCGCSGCAMRDTCHSHPSQEQK